MASLADLFSPTFLIFLGILVLVVALLVVYFESKTREQNHRIASMLSLVSTLAEDVNGIKFGLNHLAVNYMGGGQPLAQNTETNNFLNQENLIPVSDDDNDDDDDDDFEEEDESNTSEDENTVLLLDENDSDDGDNNMELIENEVDSDSDSEFGDRLEVKVLKINISNELNDDINELNDNINEIELETSNDLNELVDDLEEPEELETINDEQNITDTQHDLDFDISNLKTININLEESKNDATDYKKLSIQKLRSIVAEKGLAGDTSKLKKQDLFKLLGVE
uniref:Rho termination factor N-terminal domain-containing protein n=1 Tax=viral metagenome TaxID=1070528 RepID=A0A6C0AS52_9ZZZZ